MNAGRNVVTFTVVGPPAVTTGAGLRVVTGRQVVTCLNVVGGRVVTTTVLGRLGGIVGLDVGISSGNNIDSSGLLLVGREAGRMGTLAGCGGTVTGRVGTLTGRVGTTAGLPGFPGVAGVLFGVAGVLPGLTGALPGVAGVFSGFGPSTQVSAQPSKQHRP